MQTFENSMGELVRMTRLDEEAAKPSWPVGMTVDGVKAKIGGAVLVLEDSTNAGTFHFAYVERGGVANDGAFVVQPTEAVAAAGGIASTKAGLDGAVRRWAPSVLSVVGADGQPVEALPTARTHVWDITLMVGFDRGACT